MGGGPDIESDNLWPAAAAPQVGGKTVLPNTGKSLGLCEDRGQSSDDCCDGRAPLCEPFCRAEQPAEVARLAADANTVVALRTKSRASILDEDRLALFQAVARAWAAQGRTRVLVVVHSYAGVCALVERIPAVVPGALAFPVDSHASLPLFRTEALSFRGEAPYVDPRSAISERAGNGLDMAVETHSNGPIIPGANLHSTDCQADAHVGAHSISSDFDMCTVNSSTQATDMDTTFAAMTCNKESRQTPALPSTETPACLRIAVTSETSVLQLFAQGLVRMSDIDALFVEDVTRANGQHPLVHVFENHYAGVIAADLVAAQSERPPRLRSPCVLPRICAFMDWLTCAPGESLQAMIGRRAKLAQVSRLFHARLLFYGLREADAPAAGAQWMQPEDNLPCATRGDCRIYAKASFDQVLVLLSSPDVVLVTDDQEAAQCTNGIHAVCTSARFVARSPCVAVLWRWTPSLGLARRLCSPGVSAHYCASQDDTARLAAETLLRACVLGASRELVSAFVDTGTTGLFADGPGADKQQTQSAKRSARRPDPSAGFGAGLCRAALYTKDTGPFHWRTPAGALVVPAVAATLLSAVVSCVCDMMDENAVKAGADQPLGVVSETAVSPMEEDTPDDLSRVKGLRLRTIAVKRVGADGDEVDAHRHYYVSVLVLPPSVSALVPPAMLDDGAVTGGLSVSRNHARASVALRALQVLHSAGLLDDNLVPVAAKCVYPSAEPASMTEIQPATVPIVNAEDTRDDIVEPALAHEFVHDGPAAALWAPAGYIGHSDAFDSARRMPTGKNGAMAVDGADSNSQSAPNLNVHCLMAADVGSLPYTASGNGNVQTSNTSDSAMPIDSAGSNTVTSTSAENGSIEDNGCSAYAYAFEYDLVAVDDDAACADADTVPADAAEERRLQALDFEWTSSVHGRHTIGLVFGEALPRTMLRTVAPLGAGQRIEGRLVRVAGAPRISEACRRTLVAFQVFAHAVLSASGGDTDKQTGVSSPGGSGPRLSFMVALFKRAPDAHSACEACRAYAGYASTSDSDALNRRYAEFVSGAAPSTCGCGRWALDFSLMAAAAETPAYASLVDVRASVLPEVFETMALRMVLFAPHNGAFYRLRAWRADMKPSDVMHEDGPSFAAYMRDRHGLAVSGDADAPGMAQVVRLEGAATPLSVVRPGAGVMRGPKKASDDSAGASLPKGTFVVPEFLRVAPLPLAALRQMLLVPRLVADAERQSAALQLARDALPADTAQPDAVPWLAAALTAPGVGADAADDYERLEILGDSLLKVLSTADVFAASHLSGLAAQCHVELRGAESYLRLAEHIGGAVRSGTDACRALVSAQSVPDEGALSRARQTRVCNATLYGAAVRRLGAARYVRAAPYDSRLWAPPDVRYAEVCAAVCGGWGAQWPQGARLFDGGARRRAVQRALDGRSSARRRLYHVRPHIVDNYWGRDGRSDSGATDSSKLSWKSLVPTETHVGDGIQTRFRGSRASQAGADADLPPVTLAGVAVPAKTLADVLEALIGARYCIDVGASHPLRVSTVHEDDAAMEGRDAIASGGSGLESKCGYSSQAGDCSRLPRADSGSASDAAAAIANGQADNESSDATSPTHQANWSVMGAGELLRTCGLVETDVRDLGAAAAALSALHSAAARADVLYAADARLAQCVRRGTPGASVPAVHADALAPRLPCASDVDYGAVEAALGHAFANRDLLFVALSHATAAAPGGGLPCTGERLEWLGDALVDWVVLRHLWASAPGAPPGELTDARTRCVCNATLAAAAVRLGLHGHMRVSSVELQRSILRYASAGPGRGGAPKALGDVFEAVVGALFVDVGLDVDAAAALVLPLLRPWMDANVRVGVPRADALRDFWHDVGLASVRGRVSVSFAPEENPAGVRPGVPVALAGGAVARDVPTLVRCTISLDGAALGSATRSLARSAAAALARDAIRRRI